MSPGADIDSYLQPEAFFSALEAKSLSDEAIASVLQKLTPDALNEVIIAQWVSALLEKAEAVPQIPALVMDCCGTGGSGLPHFNTSTIVAFVLAAAGVPVVKFGNRGIQQPRGSFDFLSAIGLGSPVSLNNIPRLLEQSSLAFVFAPQCYPFLAPVHRVRKTLEVSTLFHFIGPLLNPFKPSYRLLGVSSGRLLPMIAAALSDDADNQNAWVCQTALSSSFFDPQIPALDELAPLGIPVVYAVRPQQARYLSVEELDFPSYADSSDAFSSSEALSPEQQLRQLLGTLSVEETVSIFYDLLDGCLLNGRLFEEGLLVQGKTISQNTPQVFCAELVLLNAAAGLVVSNKVTSLGEGKQLVEELFANGSVKQTFKKYREAYDACAV